MLENLRKLLFGDVLSPSSRAQLAAWHDHQQDRRHPLAGRVPKTWLVADKTGGNSNKSGNNNDVASHGRTIRGPLIVAAYCEIPGISGDERNAVHAEIGRIAADI